MITQETYITRRAKLAERNEPIAITANTEMQAKADMAFPFAQDASFFYLTGINEPDWIVLYDGKTWHLVRPRVSEIHEIFDGALSPEDAQQISGIESVLTPKEAAIILAQSAREFKSIATIGKDPHARYYGFSLNPAQQRLRIKLSKLFNEVTDCRPTLSAQRALKSSDEQAVQQAAIDLTVEAFKELRDQLPSLTHEYEIEAHFNKAFRVSGAGGHAYDPIVASGPRACTLHYNKNQEELPKNGLILIDIGAQVGSYAADITRTYALGTPSQREKNIHAAVEKAHHEIIALIRPGLAFADYQKLSDEIMQGALMGLGLMRMGDTKAYRTYFPHAISHGLGLDVHESLGGLKEFKEGMVLTVEPGIYVSDEGIGVRIEDNILVTANGSKNLSGGLPTSL